MRKFVVILLIILLCTALTACGSNDENSSEVYAGEHPYFVAEVTEVGKSYAILEVTDTGNCGISVGSEVSVNPKAHLGDDAPELAVGDTVKVEFSGEVQEIYPLSLTNIYAIDKLK